MLIIRFIGFFGSVIWIAFVSFGYEGPLRLFSRWFTGPGAFRAKGRRESGGEDPVTRFETLKILRALSN